MVDSALALGEPVDVAPRAQNAGLIGLIALAGAAAASCSLVLALTNDAIGADVGEPLVIALLSVWVTTSYILCGLYAWGRRPENRLGPLMTGRVRLPPVADPRCACPALHGRDVAHRCVVLFGRVPCLPHGRINERFDVGRHRVCSPLFPLELAWLLFRLDIERARRTRGLATSPTPERKSLRSARTA